MKLVRWGDAGQEKPGLLDQDGQLRDISLIVRDITPTVLAPEEMARLKGLNPSTLPKVLGRQRLGPPLAGVRNIHAIGLNYRRHAAETNMPIPAEPILFSKSTAAISGPNDSVIIPKGSEKTDWEVELGVVIGAACRHVAEDRALAHVAGYMVINDVSERAFQLERGGQWAKGKSADTFCPMGPWLVSADEIPNPQNLKLWLELNGDRMQDSTTGDMVFSVAQIISYLSRFLTLLPGDVIATGTPQGVGMARGRFLKPGDEMRLGVEGLGEQRQKLVVWPG